MAESVTAKKHLAMQTVDLRGEHCQDNLWLRAVMLEFALATPLHT